jgi:hypothetical protein
MVVVTVMATDRQVSERIAAEYREMPGLSLTAAQAARLFGLVPDQCVAALQALVAQGWLRRNQADRYCAAGDLDCVSRLRLLRARQPAA